MGTSGSQGSPRAPDWNAPKHRRCHHGTAADGPWWCWETFGGFLPPLVFFFNFSLTFFGSFYGALGVSAEAGARWLAAKPTRAAPKWGAKAVNGTGEGKRASSRARARAGCRSHQLGHAAGTPWGQGTFPHHPTPEDSRATGGSPSPSGQGTRSSSLHHY